MIHPAARLRIILWVGVLATIMQCDVPIMAQTGPRWKAHDMHRPRPPIVTPADGKRPGGAPSDAIVLFDGDDLSAWRNADGQPATWIVRDGYMESVPDSGYIYTAQGFGDVQLHLEWATSVVAAGTGQGRGNSGVFLMGLYEVQVLDSYNNLTYADGQASAVYGQYPPLVNAARPPGEWQSYDIIFRRPRFAPDGSLKRKARVTVMHNGIVVQDAVELWGPTKWLLYQPYTPHEAKLPLSLQDHGNPVRYRNIWLRELGETPEPEPDVANEPPVVTLPADVLKKYAGTYRMAPDADFQIVVEDDQLHAIFYDDRRLELVAHSESEFSLPRTAGTIRFDLNSDGTPKGFTFLLGGKEYVTQRVQ